MSKRGIIIPILIAIFTVCAVLPCAHAEQKIIYVSANDAILSIDDKTLPVERGGMIFVPYRVFTDNFGITAEYDSEEQILKLINGNSVLTFDILGSETFDENGEFYTYPAFSYNGTIYVCSYDVAQKNGLYYSVIKEALSGDERTILRINDKQPRFGDNVFVYLVQKKLDDALNEYKKASEQVPTDNSGQTVPTQPSEPLPSEITQPEKRTDIFLTFSNAPGEGTEKILEELGKYNYTATFFLTGEQMKDNDVLVREICGNGHSVGVGEYTDKRKFYLSAESVVTELDKTNNLLFKLCGVKTRLARVPGGSKNNLAPGMRTALSDGGYRLWDWTVSVVGYQKSDTIYSTAKELLEKTDGTVVLEMDCSEQTADALPDILKYLRRNKYKLRAIDECDTPVNFYKLK